MSSVLNISVQFEPSFCHTKHFWRLIYLHILILIYQRTFKLLKFFCFAQLIQQIFRSGSSLLGDLMSLHPSTSYTYEPFHQDHLSCDHIYNNSDIVSLVENRLMGILNCEPDVVSKIQNFSMRKNTRKCNMMNIRVVKTIRIHFNGVLPWLQKYPSLKVIYTVFGSDRSSRSHFVRLSVCLSGTSLSRAVNTVGA